MDGRSEIARIREQIRLEYEAANRVFTNFTPTAAYEFISRRQENIEAIQLIVQVEQDIYGFVPSVSGSTS